MIDDAKLMEIDETYTGSQGRTLFQRMFSKIGEGSMRGAVFNLCCIAIGAGMRISRLFDSAQSILAVRNWDWHNLVANGSWIRVLES